MSDMPNFIDTLSHSSLAETLPEPDQMNLRAVVQHGRNSFLHEVPISSIDTAQAVIQKLRAKHNSQQTILQPIKQALLFRSAIVEDIDFLQISPSDSENPIVPPRVFVQGRRRNHILTEALHDPSLPIEFPNFFISNLQYRHDIPSLRETDVKLALRIGYELDRMAVCVWLIATLLVSTGAGVCAGVAAHDFSLGLAIGTTVLGLLSAVQGLGLWLST